MYRLATLSLVVFPLFTLGCARKDDAGVPSVVLTEEEPGLDANSEPELPPDDLPELVTENWMGENPYGNLCLNESHFLSRSEILVLEAESGPGCNSDNPDVPNPDSQWFAQLEEPTPAESTQGYGVFFTNYSSRFGAMKSRLLRQAGGNDESERAVFIGLAWLAQQQKVDGGWEFDSGELKDRVAATGMALLPFLAAGETHFKAKYYRNTINSGLQFLLRNCPLSGATAGRMSSNPAAHAIATIALCEAYGMTRDKGFLLAGAQAAVNHIVKGQAPNGSWGITPGATGDIFITGWQIQALKTARLSKDIVVPIVTIKKAVDFLNLTGAGPRKAMYGSSDTTDAAPGTTQTAVGLLCRYLIDGWGPDNGGMGEGIEGLMKRAPMKSTATPDVYFHFHASQVIRFYEGEEWKTWFQGPKYPDGIRKGGLRDWLVFLQVKKDGKNQGSFDPDAAWIGHNSGRLGTTAFCVLILETPYRQSLLTSPPFIKIVDAPK